MKKRILIHGLSRNLGGIETFIFNLVKSLPPEKFAIDLLFFNDHFPFDDILSGYSYTVIYADARRKKPLQYRKQIQKILRDGRYDVVWANLFSLSDLVLLEEAAARSVKMRIAYAHVAEDTGSKLTRILSNLNQNKLKKATHFWGCSTIACEYFFQRLQSHAAYKVFPNAVFPEQYAYNPAAAASLRKEHGLDNAIIFGSIGRLVEQKNHIFIIRLMPRILELSPNIHYVVVGEGDGSLRNELEQLIQSLGVEANVHLLGFRKNVKDYYSFFDVYLMPSLYEGLPFSLIEAQMNGVRVLASDKIAAEAALAPEARFLPLDETLWLQAIEEILAEKSYAEHTVSFDIDNCDYNMHRVASVFEETILDFLRESTDSSKT